MLKKLIFILLLLITSNFALADNYREFYRYCILQKKGNYDYSIEQLDSFIKDMYTPTNFYDRLSHSAISNLVRGTTRAYDEVRNLISVMSDARYIKGKEVRNWSISTLRGEVHKYNLNKFEKACLVNCATRMLVDYTPNSPTKFSSIYEIYSQGKGVCTEMTDIALDLAHKIGLQARSVVSDEHNWPEYKINHKWYILDPTSSGCTFRER